MKIRDTRENAEHFYEMLTGVFNDEQSKIIRITCFAVLFLGVLWAGFNYFRASLLADTSTPLDEDMFQDNRMPNNDTALQRIAELAQTVDTIRRGGNTIASAMGEMNRMPFNLEPEGQGGLDPIAELGGTGSPEAVVAGSNEPKAGPLVVKMIMTTDKGQRLAVVDAGGKKAVVVRRGDMLPGEQGFVRAINPNGITVIFNKKEVKYELSEISKFNEIK